MPENDRLISALEGHVNWEAISKLFVSPPESGGARGGLKRIYEAVQTSPTKCTPPDSGGEKVTLIARNAESFSFLYQEVIDTFESVRFFDPEKDVPDLEGIDLLYLPGGYPEKHLEALVANEACRQAIKDYAERGGRIQAECGGMMYLCEQIVTDDGEYPMCGVLPYSITARKADRKLSLGYRRFVLDGKEYRGHEFHYTQLWEPIPNPSRMEWGLDTLSQEKIDSKANQAPLPSGGVGGGFRSIMPKANPWTHLYLGIKTF